MDTTSRLLDRLADARLPSDERARLRVRLSKGYLDYGDYEAAREALDGLWLRVGERPRVEDLGQPARAEVLLQAGVLTGFIGSDRRLEGSQEAAKNLISEALAAFEELGDAERVAEAQTELAYCYWRGGAFDEARVLLDEALSRLGDAESDVRALALLRRATVERSAGRSREALRLHQESADFFGRLSKPSLKGRFHVGLAETYRNLAESEARDDYIDRAFIEYEAASFHFGEAGHERFQACVENNLGCLFLFVGRYAEAHEHIDRAHALYAKLKDEVHAAQTEEMRARVLLAEGRLADAERVVRGAVRALEQGDEAALLADALMTQGVVLARQGQRAEGRSLLTRAEEVATRAGASEAAGRAALTLAEEFCDEMSPREFGDAYERAASLLAQRQQPGIRDRLNACALRFIKTATPSLETPWRDPDAPAEGEAWDNFSLRREVLRYESELIERALRDAEGSVSRAAKLLGFRHHQTFVALLNNRHKELLHARSPIVPRKVKLSARVREQRRAPLRSSEDEMRPVTILLVEDNRVVADAIRDTLEYEGWRVEICADGARALERIEGDAHFDVLVLDEDLPDVSGLEVASKARELEHRRGTPVVVISATDCGPRALDAGADVFLKKPQDVGQLTRTVARLLSIEVEA